MTSDPFSNPQSGYGPKASELVGKLVLLYPDTYREGIRTVNGEKDAVDGRMVILDGTESGEPEETTFSFMQGVLISQLRRSIGKNPVLGRMGLGEAKKGQNPPFRLSDPTDEDKDKARAFIASQDPFA
jgi:hypothetical protein